MSKKIYFLFFGFISTFAFAQNYVFGKIASEDDVELNDVTVTNMFSDESVLSDDKGHFMIQAKNGEKLRFTKKGFERVEIKVNSSHFQNPMMIKMMVIPIPIEEVEITRELTGNLAKDTKSFNKPTKIQKLEKELDSYIKRPSTSSVLSPKHGEFVQPVVRGTFSFGKIKEKWTDVDLMEYLISTLGEDFFRKEYHLEKTEIQPFIFYVFRVFERKNIIKYGAASSADIARFIDAANKKIMDYKNNIPPETQKRRLKLKVK